MLRLFLTLLLLSSSPALAADDHDHDEEAHAEEGHDDHGHDDHDDHDEDDDDHLAELEGVSILHAWTRAGRPGERDIYMEIANEGEVDVALAGGETHDGLEAVIIATRYGASGAEAVPLDSFPLAPGAEIDLTPEGLFLRVDGFPDNLEKGDTFEFHVEIEPIGEIEVVVEVEAADATQHSHAGHAH